MEFPSIYSGVKLAKSELLAAELAVIDAYKAHPFNIDDDDKLDGDGLAELAELWGLPRPAPAPPQPVPVPRRQRQRSLPRIIAAARKAGADRVVVDGTTIMLSPAAAAPEPTATDREWDTVLEVDQ